MYPSPAEIARTLAAGRLLGVVHVCGHAGPYRVRHATDPDGRPLLLTRVGSALATALSGDSGVVLRVDDVPPVPGAPTLGRVWLSGWASPVETADARTAALQFAALNPAGDLLNVGRGHALYKMEPAEVRLERGGACVDVDADDYARAQPDPVHPDEQALIVDLTDHHADAVVEMLAGHGITGRIVRLNRYGLLVDTGDRRIRLTFARPVRDRRDLAALLHPYLCPHRPRRDTPRHTTRPQAQVQRDDA